MPILLTPEENEEVYDECLQGTPIGKPFDFDGLDNARNKAQLKKVIDWLGTFKFYDDFGGESGSIFRDTLVEVLKKEAYETHD